MVSELQVEGGRASMVQRSRLRQLLVACRRFAHAQNENEGDDLGKAPSEQAVIESCDGDDGKSQVSVATGAERTGGDGDTTPEITDHTGNHIPGTTIPPPRAGQDVAVVDDLCTVNLAEVA